MSEQALNNTGDERLSAVELAAVAGGVLFLVAFLWTGSLVDSDDAIYADMARTMAATGDWIDLHWHGAVLFEKPPLLMWLVAVFGSIFGFSDLAVRLPAALTAGASLLVVASIGRRLGLDRRTRLLAVGLVLASGCFYFTGRRVMTDAPLLLFGLLSLDAWLAARLRPRRLLLWGAALGAALLTKSVAALPYALLVVLWVGLERVLPNADLPDAGGERSPLRSPWLLGGVALALLVAAPWYIAETLRHGSEFWRVFIGYHVAARAGGALVGEGSPLYYVVGASLREGGLVVLWLIGVVGVGWRALRKRDRTAWLLALWLLVTLLPIHLASTRLYHYLLPAIPPLALAAAATVAPALRRRAVPAAAALIVAALFAANNGADFVSPDYSPGTKALAPRLAALPEDATVAAIEVYDVAATWYAHRPVPLWTSSPAIYDAWGVDMMLRSHAIERLSPAEMAARVRASDAVGLLGDETRRQILDEIEAASDKAWAVDESIRERRLVTNEANDAETPETRR